MSPTPNIPAVVVVGAGPAGLMVALVAARAGARVWVLEQLPEPGVRLLATGGGHCNFTNTLAAEDFVRRFGAKRRFVAPAIHALDGSRLRLFFEELGIASHSPDGFHVLPVSDSARSIRDALRQECQNQHVEFSFNSRVDSLQTDGGQVTGIRTSHGVESASRVVLAAGGASYPGLGGGESGFELARQAGHTIVPWCPALVPLVTRETWPGTLAGVTLARVAIRLTCQGEASARSPAGQGDACRAEAGSLLFTHTGLSGPAVLDISGRVASALMTHASAGVVLDLTPDWTIEAWQEHVEKSRKEHGARTVLSLLAATFPAALAKVVLAHTDTPEAASVARLSREHSRQLIMLIKNLPLTITATEGFAKAMVTKGGVNVEEVHPKTLESKRVRGLFLAGEILDVDGPCGGFNLQWAFSSGFLAARNLMV